jgi:ADP-ribose pyrophosphatase YjhB (NUDIX family)
VDYRRIKVQAIIMNGHHVLMVRPAHGTAWALPGGEAEEGEIPEDAILRTVAEQTGAAVKVVKILTREKSVHSTHRLVLTFLAELVSLRYDPREQQGELEVDWRSLRSPELKEEIYDKHLKGKERQ